MSRTITALFDTRAEADAAVARLVAEAGVSRNLVQVHASDAGIPAGSAVDAGGSGFWASLKDLFVPDDDRSTYAEGVRRGGTVVSAQVEEAHGAVAMDILEEHGAVDLDGREAEWRQSGWTSTQGDAIVGGTMATLPTNPEVGLVATGSATAAPVASAAPVMASTTAAAAPATEVVGDPQVIPIVEENLRVGKRDVEGGRVRVRSYIVETPVSEAVTLRDEHVSVERRSVDLPLSAADDAFRERTIEAVEHGEEAVVAKEARVTEELVVRKDVGQRTETVSDTVRRTEVEIDDTTDAGRSAGTVGLTGTTENDPPGTMASRAVDKTLGTNISGANPIKR